MKRLLSLLAVGAVSIALIACGGDDEDDSPSKSTTSNPTATSSVLKLDSSFGSNGLAAIPLTSSANDRFMAVTTAPDGKVYAAGFVTENGDQMLAVARLDAAGKLDTTFGTGGIATANAAVGGKTAELARSVVVQSSGKIVIAGPAEANPTGEGDAARDTDIFLARFDTAGKLDTTFGTGGIARIDLGAGRITTGTTFAADTSWGLGNLAGDKLVVFSSTPAAAPRTDTDFVLFGVTASGQLDTAFGAGGKVVVDLNGSADNPRNLIVQTDGKIVATGYSNIGGIVSPVLIRTSTTGQLDATFGNNGVATAQVLPGVAESYSVSQQGSDYILAGYGRGADTAEKVDLIVYRFRGNGTLDTGFGGSGLYRLDIAKEDDRARNVTVLPDGRILAVGSGKRTADNIEGMVVLLSKDGAPVTEFGESGRMITDLGGPSDSLYGVSVSADKKYVYVAGYKGVAADSGGNDDSVVIRLVL